jgi:hypothetical protein
MVLGFEGCWYSGHDGLRYVTSKVRGIEACRS